MINQNLHRPKSKANLKAFTSLILGIFSILPFVGREIVIHWIRTIPAGETVAYFLLRTPLLAFIGLLLGILSLKSSKRKFAIVGIILCGISLLVSLYYFLFY